MKKKLHAETGLSVIYIHRKIRWNDRKQAIFNVVYIQATPNEIFST